MNQLIEYIESNKNKIIGLDGPSGSGKSTLALFLEQQYNVLVFHTDDYFLSPEQKTEERLNEPGGNIDYERMETEIFKNLDRDYIPSHKFNCMTNQLEKRNLFKKKSIILIEGVYSLHSRFQKYYDLKVFKQVDKDTQVQRIMKRNGEKMLQRFLREWIPLEDRYFTELKIEKVVDIFI